MKSLPSFGLRFSRVQKAVLFLLTLLLFGQWVVFFTIKKNTQADVLLEDEVLQAKWDNAVMEKSRRIYPFNPNYISAYKAYQLDLNASQYQLIKEWRDKGNFFKSKEEFQTVTAVSEDWLKVYSPYFKFPAFRKRGVVKKPILVPLGEINTATSYDLQKVSGVGEILSQRIIKYKSRLGGFATFDQLYEVYGLDSVVVQRIKKQFSLSAVSYRKMDLQTVSVSELAALPYLNYPEAKQLVALRTRNDTLSLMGAKTFLKWEPLKFRRLALYLY